MRIKICGLTQFADAYQALQLGAWALGFIFYKKSSRWIEPMAVQSILAQLAERGLQPQHSVGVFVNARVEEIYAVAGESGINTVQLHGDENPEFCARIQGLTVWKAWRSQSTEILQKMADFEPFVQGFLFDAAVAGQYGGTGQLANWDLVANAKSIRPIILSGGLNAENISAAAKKVQAFAYDLSSGVEQCPGIKDANKLSELFANGNAL